MKNNYPIKYTLLPIINQTSYMHKINKEEKYSIVCYIVSKCYLMSEIKKYNQNGMIDEEYQIVYPYIYNESNLWIREEPNFNIISGNCTNSVIVNQIFNNYDDAVEVKNEKNNELFYNQYSSILIKEYVEKIKQYEDEFNKKISYYNEIEKDIELKTNDLKIDNEKVIKLIKK